ncbi:MAG: dihydrolipoamide acetyltransferase family protein [Bacteroidetes bacterium]|nr:dihydrolipoamide acetyltransferase family protein [Bacteroidota bacterium]MDA0879919.1 dihydrolipoamide acetyltransferase family protein [Bacteroidota bacterium]MDA1116058.1 dihydrolipoamide acetyltransferase family protein [Bacteroidota bacterium]
MARYELKLPKMGESVAEATVTNWLKGVGDAVSLDEDVLEIATDKVDSGVPSEVSGVLVEMCFEVDQVAQVGDTLAIIETEGAKEGQKEISEPEPEPEPSPPEIVATVAAPLKVNRLDQSSADSRFYSPLVKNIAKTEGVSQIELSQIAGTGKDGRVTKNDILNYIEQRTQSSVQPIRQPAEEVIHAPVSEPQVILPSGEDQIIEMSRMGKLVAKHMVDSIHTSAHVQSFVEVDVTKIWNWRTRVKDEYLKREGEPLTFTPIFMEAVAQTLRDFPMMNISVQGDQIIIKKHINLGMATALGDGNLIVPVIKDADQLNLRGLSKRVNDLANRARNNKLKPEDIQDGTYTVTNVGTFGSIMGTPIINQPQVGILALGAIRKVPAVIETAEGDFIGIRHKMFLSHSYDHRVVNGALGGQFVQAVKLYLEAWDENRSV